VAAGPTSADLLKDYNGPTAGTRRRAWRVVSAQVVYMAPGSVEQASRARAGSKEWS
jgi:hypothetical protein